MSSNQENCKARTRASKPELTAMASHSQRIVRNRAIKSFPTTLRQPELSYEAVLELEESLEAALESDTGGLPCKPITRRDSVPVAISSISDLSIVLKLRNAMRKMAQDEAKRIFAAQVGLSMQNAAGEALSDIFVVGSVEASTGFKNTFYHVTKRVLTKMAASCSLEDMFERNIER